MEWGEDECRSTSSFHYYYGTVLPPTRQFCRLRGSFCACCILKCYDFCIFVIFKCKSSNMLSFTQHFSSNECADNPEHYRERLLGERINADQTASPLLEQYVCYDVYCPTAMLLYWVLQRCFFNTTRFPMCRKTNEAIVENPSTPWMTSVTALLNPSTRCTTSMTRLLNFDASRTKLTTCFLNPNAC